MSISWIDAESCQDVITFTLDDTISIDDELMNREGIILKFIECDKYTIVLYNDKGDKKMSDLIWIGGLVVGAIIWIIKAPVRLYKKIFKIGE